MSPAGARRFDPYARFKFGLRMDGRRVAGFSGLRLSRDAPSAPIPLQRGISQDRGFAAWMRGEDTDGAGGDGAGPGRDVVLEVYDLSGRLAIEYLLARARVVDGDALPDLDANVDTLVFEQLDVAHDGWTRLDPS